MWDRWVCGSACARTQGSITVWHSPAQSGLPAETAAPSAPPPLLTVAGTVGSITQTCATVAVAAGTVHTHAHTVEPIQ